MTATLTVQSPVGALSLLADCAAYLPREGLLLVADAHLGKSQTFRKLGVPVPVGTMATDLQRLSYLIRATAPRELVFLGDLLHASQGRSDRMLQTMADWRHRHHALAMRLVRGNHDQRAGDPPSDWDVRVVEEPWLVGPWALCHHPQQLPGSYVLAGHDHPCTALGSGPRRLRLPCFHLMECCGVLPAFGGFTGMHRIQRAQGDQVVVIVQGELRLLP